ncbi:hypothetical protein KQI42_14850 [Tissierella sp. MSJ-40]|uniref:Protein kinase domain-containing protein n=1 Tax=Tissierella simiarum TaxID=2841534 RepID=A0ABS6EA62_9FIRM|nr:AarF/UbiB family protein [Tissierella simiarum]MBU5439300.1 hypothetical protein [Tissierella simiarum]
MLIKGKWNGNGYQVIGYIGKGNFGTVYKVKDTKGNIRALKLSKDTFSMTNEYEGMKSLKNLFHIPKVYDFDDWDTRGDLLHFIVMDYIEGNNLRELSQINKLSKKEIFKIGYLLLIVLKKIDKLGYRYTDIKLENVIINNRGKLFLLDLGSLILKDSITKEYTPTYNINSWIMGFSATNETSIIFSVTMIMVSLLGNKEFNPMAYSLEDVVSWVNNLNLRKEEKDFLIKGLRGKFLYFNNYTSRLLSLTVDKGKDNRYSLYKIDFLLMASIVFFIFTLVLGYIKIIL